MNIPPKKGIMADQRSSSPNSEHQSDGMDSLSMRDKMLLKRNVSKHHNNNFKAGYVPVHEQYLHRTGIRGRKTFAFWTLMCLLFILAAGNLALTAIILGVLRLGQGMESLELVPEESSIKFFGDTDLGHIYKRDGKLEGFLDIPIEISGENGSIYLNLVPGNAPNHRSEKKLTMKRRETIFQNLSAFDVKNNNGKLIFSLHDPHLNIIKKAKHFRTDFAQSNRIVSPVDSNLKLEGRTVSLKGSEGTHLEGKELLWTADENVYFKSSNGSIILTGNDGIYLDTKRIPIATVKENASVTSQYKVCVCMPQGKLFKIPIPKDPKVKVYCNHFHSQRDPCI